MRNPFLTRLKVGDSIVYRCWEYAPSKYDIKIDGLPMRIGTVIRICSNYSAIKVRRYNKPDWVEKLYYPSYNKLKLDPENFIKVCNMLELERSAKLYEVNKRFDDSIKALYA